MTYNLFCGTDKCGTFNTEFAAVAAACKISGDFQLEISVCNCLGEDIVIFEDGYCTMDKRPKNPVFVNHD